MAAEQDALRRKNEDIAKAYKEKKDRLVQTQELYDKVKRRAEMGHIQQAAADAVYSSLHAGNQADMGFGSDMRQDLTERNHVPTFSQSNRIDVSGMNAGIPLAQHTISRNDNRWSQAKMPPRCKSCI